MVDVSIETPEATERRLLEVIRCCRLEVYERPYAFQEMELHEFPSLVRPDAVALVRDDEIWSQLVPADPSSTERFGLFRFHFEPNLDNSGFVGWLATFLKRQFGAGLFVVCGHNSRRGGIFDYWGCPVSLHKQIIAAVHKLRENPGRDKL